MVVFAGPPIREQIPFRLQTSPYGLPSIGVITSISKAASGHISRLPDKRLVDYDSVP
jgi:hypothetical protein